VSSRSVARDLYDSFLTFKINGLVFRQTLTQSAGSAENGEPYGAEIQIGFRTGMDRPFLEHGRSRRMAGGNRGIGQRSGESPVITGIGCRGAQGNHAQTTGVGQREGREQLSLPKFLQGTGLTDPQLHGERHADVGPDHLVTDIDRRRNKWWGIPQNLFYRGILYCCSLVKTMDF